MRIGVGESLSTIAIVHVGGCHVPGLNDCPDPIGSDDLETNQQLRNIYHWKFVA